MKTIHSRQQAQDHTKKSIHKKGKEQKGQQRYKIGHRTVDEDSG